MDFRTQGYRDFKDDVKARAVPRPPWYATEILWALGCGVLVAWMITRGALR